MEPEERLRMIALDQINAVRQWAGLDKLDAMPVGKLASHCDCPVARALDGTGATEVSAASISVAKDVPLYQYARALGGLVDYTYERGLTVQFVVPPWELARFIAAFDMGDYPDLVEQ